MEFIRQNLYLIFPAIASGAALIYLTFFRPEKKNALTPTQATLLINREEPQIIDLREAGDYASGHLPESRNIPLKQLDDRTADFEKSKESPLLFVCRKGEDSATACVKLTKKGFTRAHYVEGGIEAWREDGLPLKKGTKK